MSRSERWNTVNEIKRRFHETTDPVNGAGPVVCVENGRKYSDDSESHVAVIGRTGRGKTQCCVLPQARNIADKNESMIISDPKGQIYKMIRCFLGSHYQVFCLDFRNPRKSPTKWNPLSTPYRLFRSKDPDDNDIASSMLSELWNGVYPYDGHSDKFWTDSSVNYAKGLTYGLFETASEDQINLDSVAVMMEQSEIRMGPGNLLKTFYEDLPHDSLAKRNLATYVTAPNETRASIHSVAASGLEVFSRSKGLMEMLSDDTLNIMDIDVERPFACFIITPDETDVYDSLSGLLISQLTQHLIRVAQEKGGRLPIRVNIILEELGSVGKSIPTLPNLMVASRSRNIRLMLVLQSIAQLVDVYGKSKAETINSCIGITIGFSTNSWETLTEWAQRCGEKQIENSGHIIKEQLITASQLAAMPTGTALVMVDSQYKFIAHLPFYDEMYDNSKWKAPHYKPTASARPFKSLDFEAMVKEIKKKQMESTLSGFSAERKATEAPRGFSFFEEARSDGPLDIDSLISRIDAKIAELEAEEEAERKKQKAEKKYHVIITEGQNNIARITEIIAAAMDESLGKAAKRLTQFPVDISFNTRSEAVKFAQDIANAGGKATIKAS